MDFLHQLDSLHRKCMRENNVTPKNRDFRSYHEISFDTESMSDRFLIQKNMTKAKLLLVDGEQKVYLSDSQIIETILSLGITDIQWFVTQLCLLYSGKGSYFGFTIGGEKYNFTGISSYPGKKEILLPSDTTIDIGDFCIIVNFVYAKDFAWEKIPITEKSRKKGYDKTNFSKRTLCKYISLIDHYGLHSNRSEKFLQAIGYPLTKNYPGSVEKEKTMFANVKLFDISSYM